LQTLFLIYENPINPISSQTTKTMNLENLTKQEAIQLMQEGKCITHRHFSPSEWMRMNKNGKILFEDGVECSVNEFFLWRKGESWESCYSIYPN